MKEKIIRIEMYGDCLNNTINLMRYILNKQNDLLYSHPNFNQYVKMYDTMKIGGNEFVCDVKSGIICHRKL